MNKKLKTLLAAGFLVVGMAAQACTLAAWDNTTGTAAGGGPGDANVLARYSGLCSMDGTGGAVINNGMGPTGNGTGAAISGPAGEAAMIVRFYFLATGSGTTTIFETYDGEVPGAAGVNPIYTVTYDGTNVTVTPTGTGGTVASAPVGATNWHSVEIKWASGGAANSIELWVDSDAKTAATSDAQGTSATAAASIQAVQLGGIVPASYTTLLFDDYESRRTTSIGRLVPGDAATPMDGTVDVSDLQSVIDEILGIGLSAGVANCDQNDIVNADVSDLQCVINIILGI